MHPQPLFGLLHGPVEAFVEVGFVQKINGIDLKAVERVAGFERGSNVQAAGGWLNYQRTSGEVEARNAQHRRHMKTDERRKSLWSDTTEPEHKNPDNHLYPTKYASRKQHKEDVANAKQANQTKAKHKRKQMQQALAVEIELNMRTA